MSKVLERIKNGMKTEIDFLNFKVEYLPGSSLHVRGSYSASFKPLGLVCYGPTAEQALASIKEEMLAISLKEGSVKRALALNQDPLTEDSKA